MNEHQFLPCHLLCRFSRNQSDRRYCSPHAMSSVSKKFKVRGPLLCCIHLIKFESDPYHVFARLESYTILDILGGSYHLLSRLYGYNYPSTTLVISGLYSISFFCYLTYNQGYNLLSK